MLKKKTGYLQIEKNMQRNKKPFQKKEPTFAPEFLDEPSG
jgi:hypothetical protein